MAVSLAPLPDAIDERVATELMTVLAFLCEILFDRILHRDARVIGAGEPEGVVPLHPARADDDVLQRDIERMAEMELAGDVRRRNYDREDFAGTRGIGGKRTRLGPQ